MPPEDFSRSAVIRQERSSMQQLIKKYAIEKGFFGRYFVRNGINHYAFKVLEFMLWRRGTFLNPIKKDQYISQFIAEEIENFYEKNELNIPMLQFALTTKCTLKCKDCNALIPQFNTHGHLSYTFDELARELDVVCNAASKIRWFILLGGEPLINKDLPQMAAYCAQKNNIGAVEIITNGTIMPSMKLLEVCKKYNNKIYFHFSNYSKNEALKSILKYDEIIAVLKENSVKHKMSDDSIWNAEDTSLADRGYCEQRLKTMYEDCWFKGCAQVLNGKIATCPRASAAAELINMNDYIDLKNSKNLKKDFIDFYKKDSSEACRYCVRIGKRVTPAIQIRQKEGAIC
jgi:organic radical activating enzyme